MPTVMQPVYSSQVVAVGYDPDTHSMRVEWKSGKVSVYEGVPAAVVEQVRNSASVGKTIRSDIIPNYKHKYA
jgi:short-subunit dehydrogenase involved in D-alanine esterification of teichoic acids